MCVERKLMHTILAAPQPVSPALAPKISLDYMMFAHEVRQPCYNSSGAIFLSACCGFG